MQKLFWTFNLTDNIEIKTINLQSHKNYRAISKRFQTVKYLLRMFTFKKWTKKINEQIFYQMIRKKLNLKKNETVI